jgi:antitoxin (DNA-binding transcriptional repressor) of toxin-antitoxin stability system
MVMKQVAIAEFKSKLSELLRMVRGVNRLPYDRNAPIPHVVPIREQRGPCIRKPALGAPAPNKVLLPEAADLKFDVLQLLLEERQSHR